MGLGFWAAMAGCSFVDVADNGLLECNCSIPVTQTVGRINHSKGVWYLSRRAITLWLMTAPKHIYLRLVGFSLPFLPKAFAPDELASIFDQATKHTCWCWRVCLGPNSQRRSSSSTHTHTDNTPPPPPCGTRQHDAKQHLRDRACQAHSRLSASSKAATALALSPHPALCRRIHDDSLRPLPSPGRTTLRVDLDCCSPHY